MLVRLFTSHHPYTLCIRVSNLEFYAQHVSLHMRPTPVLCKMVRAVRAKLERMAIGKSLTNVCRQSGKYARRAQ